MNELVLPIHNLIELELRPSIYVTLK